MKTQCSKKIVQQGQQIATIFSVQKALVEQLLDKELSTISDHPIAYSQR